MAQRLRYLILACLLLSAAQVIGQELPEGWRQFEFKVYALNRTPIEGLHYELNDATIPLKFKKKRRSDVYNYRGPAVVSFFSISENNAGEPLRIPMGSVSVPAKVRQPLFLFLEISDPNSTEPHYRISVIDDSPSAFPYGHLMVFNSSGSQLVGKVGAEHMQVGYGASETWPIRHLHNRSNVSVINIFFAAEVLPKEFELVYRNSVSFSEGCRAIMVLRPPRHPRSIKIETYLLEDYPLKEEIRQSDYLDEDT